MDWSLYEKRVTLNGKTRREIEINNLKEELKIKLLHNPSCKDVKIKEEEHKLIINSGTETYKKKITTLPDDITVFAGDIVDWADSKWLITSLDSDNEIYSDGEMLQCGYKLRWQEDDGNIVDRWVFTGDASAYNSGIKGDKVVKTGYDQIKVWFPYDEKTLNLKRGKRMFIDHNTISPTPYELTRIDTTSDVYDNHGVITAIFTESQLTEQDNIELLICDYKETETFDDTTIEITSNSNYVIVGYNNGTQFASSYKENNEEVQNYNPIWKLNCDFQDKLNIYMDNKKIIIATDDETLIGRSFTLNLYINDLIQSKVITIIGNI